IECRVGAFLEEAGQVAIGENAGKAAGGIDEHYRPGAAAAMAHLSEYRADGFRRRGDAEFIALAHRLVYRGEFAAEAAGRVEPREIFRRELPFFQKCE